MTYTNARDASTVCDLGDKWVGPSPQLKKNDGCYKKAHAKSLDEYDGYKDYLGGYYTYAQLSGYDRRPGLPSNRLVKEYEPEIQ